MGKALMAKNGKGEFLQEWQGAAETGVASMILAWALRPALLFGETQRWVKSHCWVFSVGHIHPKEEHDIGPEKWMSNFRFWCPSKLPNSIGLFFRCQICFVGQGELNITICKSCKLTQNSALFFFSTQNRLYCQSEYNKNTWVDSWPAQQNKEVNKFSSLKTTIRLITVKTIILVLWKLTTQFT